MTKERFKLLSSVSTFNVFRSAPFGIALHEMIFDGDDQPQDYRFLEVNPAFERITQLKVTDLKGKLVTETIPGIDHELINLYGDLVKTGKSQTYIRYSNRLQRYLEIKAFTPGKNLFITIVDDVTDSTLKDKALKESESKFRTLHTNMTQGVVYQDQNGVILSANPSACKILGLTLDQMQGRSSIDPSWRAVDKNGDDFPGERHPAIQALKSGKTIKDVVMGVHHAKEEKLVWIHVTAVPLFRGNTEKPFQVFTTFEDITDRRKTQMALVQSEKDKEEALEESRIKSSFLANMSHEIRTPLNGIVGMIDLMSQSQNLSDEHRDKVEIIKQSSSTLLSIINDILELSKLQAGKFELKEEATSINGMGEQLKKLFSVQAENKNISLNFFPLEKDLSLLLDSKVKQLLANFIGNAIKFTDQGGVNFKVQLETLNNFEAIVNFEVEDTGIGIGPEHEHEIFAEFKQINDSLNKEHRGSGLGLAICKQLAELMGGEIGMTSKLGTGSLFWFKLKAKRVRSHVDEPIHKGGLQKAIEKVNPLNLDVLVVDDNEINLKVAELMLQKMKCRVSKAVDGFSAIEACENERFDLILMDVQMPKMNGIEATKKIKEMLITSAPPIIGLSANALKGDAERFINEGMDDYLSKPVTLTDLKNKILHWFPEKK
jgi:PAS domain S-box-containing protein